MSMKSLAMRLALPALLGFLAACTLPTRPVHEANPALARYADAVDFARAGDEAVALLQQYIAVDTRNPPGNEQLGAEFLSRQLQSDGIEFSFDEFAPGRASLIARVRAQKPSGEKPLCLLSHLDVVPAEDEQWPTGAGPMSGTLLHGEIWGRGALDMKGMGVLELQVLRWLKRQAVPLHRDVILIAEGDEEVGQLGMQHLMSHRWAELGCGHVINEGGLGVRGLLKEGQTAFAISVGEKGVLWVRVVAEGEAGHGSTPSDIRAPSRLVTALSRLAARQPTARVQPAMYEFLQRAGAQMGGLQGAVMQRPSLVRLLAMKKLLAKPTTRAAVTDTCQVTGFDGMGSAPNVIPSKTEAVLDCRILPGSTPEGVLEELQALVKDIEGIRLEVVRTLMPAVSDWDDALFDALARHAVAGRNDAFAGPVISPGYTDSVLARQHGAKAYGFIPFEVTTEELGTMHGKNERVSVDNVRRGFEVLFRAVVDVSAVP